MRNIVVEIRKSKSKKQPFCWRIRSSNGQIYCNSETYTTRANAVSAYTNMIKCIVLSQVVLVDLIKRK